MTIAARRAVSRALIGVAAAAALVAAGALPVETVLAAPQGSRWGADWFPNYEVTTHTGETFNFYEDLIEDKLVVVNFFYTRCDDICPLQTARMAQVVDRLGDRVGKDIFVYSITIEPEYDTQPVIASLADAFDVRPGWLFLTGKPEHIKAIGYSLGERSRSLSEHGNDLMIGNDRGGVWGRSSLFADIDRIALEVLEMDPEWRAVERQQAPADRVSLDRQTIADDRGRGLFVKACAACHNIGGPEGLGPDLYGVAERRDHGWLAAFIRDPQRLRREGDAAALALDAAYPVMNMPGLALSPTDVGDLIHFLASEQARIDAGGGALVRGRIDRRDEAAAIDAAPGPR